MANPIFAFDRPASPATGAGIASGEAGGDGSVSSAGSHLDSGRLSGANGSRKGTAISIVGV
jgi:hypothetical protein